MPGRGGRWSHRLNQTPVVVLWTLPWRVHSGGEYSLRGSDGGESDRGSSTFRSNVRPPSLRSGVSQTAISTQDGAVIAARGLRGLFFGPERDSMFLRNVCEPVRSGTRHHIPEMLLLAITSGCLGASRVSLDTMVTARSRDISRDRK
jgi:hypothetical protein